MVRSYLGTCGAVAGAGILALGLVVVTTSEAHAARIDMRAVRVASVALPSTPPLGLQVVTIRAADQTAAPTDPVTFLTENAQILADGIGQSADRAAVAVVGEAVLPFVTAFLAVASPARIPTILLLTQESSESIWTGALNTKFGIGYDEFVPGFYIPADVEPTGNLGDAHDYALRRIVGALVPSSNVRTAADNQASFGSGRTIVRSSDSDSSTTKSTANPTRKKPVRDAITKVGKDISHTATQVRDNLKKAMGQ